MSLQASVIMLGVQVVDRSRRFYVDGLGCEVSSGHRRIDEFLVVRRSKPGGRLSD